MAKVFFIALRYTQDKLSTLWALRGICCLHYNEYSFKAGQMIWLIIVLLAYDNWKADLVIRS